MAEISGFFYPRTATGRSSLLPPPPWHYSGDLLTVEYRTDPARVAELLPGPLQPAPEDPQAGARRRGAPGAGRAVLPADAADRERAARVSAQLVAGTVWVNCFFVCDLRAPFGGARQSGIGREGGTWSFDFYGDVKNTVYAPEGWRHG